MFNTLPELMQKSLNEDRQVINLRGHNLAGLSIEQWQDLSSGLLTHPEEVLEIDLGLTRLHSCNEAARNHLITWVNKCENLLSITLDGNSLGAGHRAVEFLIALLKGCKKLQHINISDNFLYCLSRSSVPNNSWFGFTHSSWKFFCDMLSTLSDLQSINLSGNSLDMLKRPEEDIDILSTQMAAWKILLESLAKCKKLRIMDLNSNDLENINHVEWGFICEHFPKQLMTIKCSYRESVAAMLDENGICKYANFFYDDDKYCLTNATYRSPAFKSKVLCFMSHAIAKNHADKPGIGFFESYGLYRQMAPFLTYKDAENMQRALTEEGSKPDSFTSKYCTIM